MIDFKSKVYAMFVVYVVVVLAALAVRANAGAFTDNDERINDNPCPSGQTVGGSRVTTWGARQVVCISTDGTATNVTVR